MPASLKPSNLKLQLGPEAAIGSAGGGGVVGVAGEVGVDGAFDSVPPHALRQIIRNQAPREMGRDMRTSWE